MVPPYPVNSTISIGVIGADAHPRSAGLAARPDRTPPWDERATAPADRPIAEAAVAGLYRMIGAERPRFVWIDSPLPYARPGLGDWSLRTNEAIAAEYGGPEAGAFLLTELEEGRAADSRGLRRKRTVADRLRGSRAPYRRRAEAGRRRELERRLTLWADLAGSCGGWWPFERVCVLSERPVEVHTEPMPEWDENAVRPHRRDGPAVRYRDGSCLYALHGTLVPEEIITDMRATAARTEGKSDDLAALIESSEGPALADLIGKDYRGADLRGVSFPDFTDLTRADFSGADLRYADLSGADAWLGDIYADFGGARFVGVDLRATNLGGIASFTEADLTDADLSGCRCRGGAPEVGSWDFIDAKLVRTDLTGSDLFGTPFRGADLTGADLTGANVLMHEGEPWHTSTATHHAFSAFAGAVWDNTTRWPDERSHEIMREVSDPVDDERFRVRPPPPDPPVPNPVKPIGVDPGDALFR